MNNARLAPFVSLSLKVLGGVLILSTLVDYFLAAFPFMIMENAWQITFTNQLVSRGTNPMIGIIALLLAAWVDANAGKKVNLRPAVTDTRFLSVVLSLILGAIFLLVIPLHLTNLQEVRDQYISQIEQQTQQQEQQVQSRYNQLQMLVQTPNAKEQIEQQLQAIDEAIANGQVPPAQAAAVEAQRQELLDFQRYINDPESLNTRLEELRTEVETRRDEQQKQAENTVIKEAAQIGLRSLFLSVGYILIAWLGFNTIMGGGSSAKPPSSEFVEATDASEPPTSEQSDDIA